MQEAEELLEGKLTGAQSTLANCEEDLDFLREQITVGRPLVFRITGLVVANQIFSDFGGCDRKSLQLGCDNAKEAKRGRWKGGRRKGIAKRVNILYGQD